MFVFFVVNFMARSFIEERQLETLKRLRIAAISPTGLLLGYRPEAKREDPRHPQSDAGPPVFAAARPAPA